MRATRRPRSCSDAKSPAACARISCPKPNGWPGIGSSSPGVVDDLQEEPGRRAALVQLPGRVQVARPEAVRDDAARRLARAAPASASTVASFARGRVDERLDADVVARAAPARTAPRASRPARRRGSAPEASTSLRLVLRRLHVRLVERVDPEHRAGDRGRELPAEELLAELVRARRARTSCAWRSGPSAAPPGAGIEPLALLAGRLGDQLLGPEPEAAGVRRDADLVAAVAPALAEREAELEARVALGEAAGLGHLERALEQPRRRRRPSAPRAPSRTARAPSSARRSSARPRRSPRTRARARAASSSEPGIGDRGELLAVAPVCSQK